MKDHNWRKIQFPREILQWRVGENIIQLLQMAEHVA